jgi:hypothetical protein
MRSTRYVSVCMVLAFVLLAEKQAHAYTDPGSGALIWQGLVAAFVGAGFYFRKAIFHLMPKKKIDSESEKSEQ